eukprot:6820644-Pyramimonas_sp.AAC.1
MIRAPLPLHNAMYPTASLLKGKGALNVALLFAGPPVPVTARIRTAPQSVTALMTILLRFHRSSCAGDGKDAMRTPPRNEDCTY